MGCLCPTKTDVEIMGDLRTCEPGDCPLMEFALLTIDGDSYCGAGP